MSDVPVLQRRILRGLVVAIAVFGSISIVFALMPGYEVRIGDVIVERRFAGGVGFAAFVCWLIGPGLVLWLHPRLEVALVWSLLGWAGWLLAKMAGVGFGTDDLYDWSYHTRRLWTADAMQQALAPVMFVLLIGFPAACIASVVAKIRARRAALPPVARIHRER